MLKGGISMAYRTSDFSGFRSCFDEAICGNLIIKNSPNKEDLINILLFNGYIVELELLDGGDNIRIIVKV